VTFVLAVAFLAVPQGWNDPVLNRPPSLHWREICRCVKKADDEPEKQGFKPYT
jgi:hypothetical protein